MVSPTMNKPAQESATSNAPPRRKKKPLKDDTSSDESVLSSSKLGSDSEEPSSEVAEDEEDNEGGQEANNDDDSHMDECAICEDGGELICCDGKGCDKAYHAECVNVDIDTLPLTWLCPSCIEPQNPRKKKSPNDKSSAASVKKKKRVESDNDAGSEESIEGLETKENKGGTESKFADKNKDRSSDDDSIEVVQVTLSPSKTKAPVSSNNEKANTIDTGKHLSSAATSDAATDEVPQKTPDMETRAPSKINNNRNTDDTKSKEKQPAERKRAAKQSLSSLEGLGGGKANDSPPANKEHAKESDTSHPPTPTFRTVTVPEGVLMGEMFHVLLGKGKVMGVVCPEGVQPGDKMIILEPNQEPPIPPAAIAKMNARRLLDGIEKSEYPSIVANAFWNVLWPALHAQGWVYTRQMHYNFGAITFFTPGSTELKKTERVLNTHYFETMKSVVTTIANDPKLAKDQTILEKFNAEVEKQKEAMKEKKNKQKKEKRRVEVLEKVADIDAWKYSGEREQIQVGSQYQVRMSQIPKAGSYKSGEEEEYIKEQITDPAALKASLTPAAWYEFAKEPNLADKFHTAIMKCKKQLPAVASALDKPFGFCLWYYYHKYKIPSNSENYEQLKQLVDDLKVHSNSDECAICDEGGDLVCCETCTDSYHLMCLGLQSEDVEGEWSCPACTRKRKLQLSPPKSPKKKRLSGESDYSPTKDGDQS